jgi:chaperonin cofactor prefoldin
LLEQWKTAAKLAEGHIKLLEKKNEVLEKKYEVLEKKNEVLEKKYEDVLDLNSKQGRSMMRPSKKCVRT